VHRNSMVIKKIERATIEKEEAADEMVIVPSNRD
jgi:hypothetical protein